MFDSLGIGHPVTLSTEEHEVQGSLGSTDETKMSQIQSQRYHFERTATVNQQYGKSGDVLSKNHSCGCVQIDPRWNWCRHGDYQ